MNRDRMWVMTMLLWWAAFVGAVLTFDRIMVWMERRGWIYWREQRGSSAASAIGTLAEFWDLSRAHVQAETRRLQDDIDDEAEGAPPKMRLTAPFLERSACIRVKSGTPTLRTVLGD